MRTNSKPGAALFGKPLRLSLHVCSLSLCPAFPSRKGGVWLFRSTNPFLTLRPRAIHTVYARYIPTVDQSSICETSRHFSTSPCGGVGSSEKDNLSSLGVKRDAKSGSKKSTRQRMTTDSETPFHWPAILRVACCFTPEKKEVVFENQRAVRKCR